MTNTTAYDVALQANEHGTVEATLFDPVTGEIIINFSGMPDTLLAYDKPFIMGTYHWDEWYVEPSGPHPVPMKRTKPPIEQNAQVINAGDSLVLSSIPQSPFSRVHIAGQSYEVADGALDWTTQQPGVYKITVEAYPKHLLWESRVEVR